MKSHSEQNPEKHSDTEFAVFREKMLTQKKEYLDSLMLPDVQKEHLIMQMYLLGKMIIRQALKNPKRE
jgi:hypothetical protein